jgi:signal transduction histidine kinase
VRDPLSCAPAEVAELVHDEVLVDDRELLDAMSSCRGCRARADHLEAELRARLRRDQGVAGRASSKATQRERRKLERDLHDGAQQRFVTATLNLALLASAARSGGPRPR